MADAAFRAMSLVAEDGARKRLSPRERGRVFAALETLGDPFARTYCEMIFRTGCRPSETLTMTAAGLGGVRACARGLRHSHGVAAALQRVPQAQIRTWLGHASLETTAIYFDRVGQEDREMAARIRRCGEPDDE